jgi:hypothetical protein
VPVGIDPIAAELSTTYGTPNIYGAHWILDTTDWYGYGIDENGTGDSFVLSTHISADRRSRCG